MLASSYFIMVRAFLSDFALAAYALVSLKYPLDKSDAFGSTVYETSIKDFVFSDIHSPVYGTVTILTGTRIFRPQVFGLVHSTETPHRKIGVII